MKLGLVATTNPGGVAKWRADFCKPLTGRRVAILPDNDEAGRSHAEAVRASLAGAGITAAIVASTGCRPRAT